jgi:hypothetical protein
MSGVQSRAAAMKSLLRLGIFIKVLLDFFGSADCATYLHSLRIVSPPARSRERSFHLISESLFRFGTGEDTQPTVAQSSQDFETHPRQ